MFRVYFLLSGIMTINQVSNWQVFQQEKRTSLLSKVGPIHSETDTIRINPDSIEGDVNLSPLNLKTGIYIIGDTMVDLKQFKFFNTDKLSSLISKNPDLTYLARVNVEGRSYGYSDAKEDTVVRFGKLRKKYLPKKNKYISYDIGFKNGCPPSNCYYYYLCQRTNGTIKTITNPQQLITLIKHVKNAADAFFLLDDFEYVHGRYAENKNGIFILVNNRVSDCPMRFADILYFVSKDGKVKELTRNVTNITSICI